MSEEKFRLINTRDVGSIIVPENPFEIGDVVSLHGDPEYPLTITDIKGRFVTLIWISDHGDVQYATVPWEALEPAED